MLTGEQSGTNAGRRRDFSEGRAIADASRKGRGGLGRREFGLPEGPKMFRAALFESGYRHAMFGDTRRGKVNQNPPPKMSRIYREDRSMGMVVQKRRSGCGVHSSAGERLGPRYCAIIRIRGSVHMHRNYLSQELAGKVATFQSIQTHGPIHRQAFSGWRRGRPGSTTPPGERGPTS